MVFSQVVRHLIAAGHDVHVVTGAPDFVFTSEIKSPRLFIRKVLCLLSSGDDLVLLGLMCLFIAIFRFFWIVELCKLMH